VGLPLAAAMLALGSGLLVPAASGSSSQQSGTFRMAISGGSGVASIEPALGLNPILAGPTCGGLMRHPDKPFPAGLTLVPEIADGFPKITEGGRSYTFTIGRGVRFSTGAPVTARSFAHTINRTLSKQFESPLASSLEDIVGARAVMEGNATEASGVTTRGDRLTVRLTRPAGDFTTRVGTLCVVPETTPVHPEGVSAPLAAAGPFYIAEFTPGRKVTLLRNRFYRGDRRPRMTRFDIDLTLDAPTIIERVERGELDYAAVRNDLYAPRARELLARYGINRSRFFAAPSNNLRTFVLNTSRPLFRNNVELRQAVNFAVDRRALLYERGPLAGVLTDQFLMPGTPGFRRASIYPLRAPNVAKARELAKGRTRGGKAVLYAPASPLAQTQAQILRYNLKAIGLDVEIVTFPGPVLFAKLATPGEPFDIGWIGFIDTAQDSLLNQLFDGNTIGQPGFRNYSYFDSPRYNRRLDAASRLPVGAERYRRYGELDVDITRNAAPAVALSYDRELTFVSARTGCVVLNPTLDLAVVCVR
jgi:peptide/nickel transport system substrate-binding protein